MQAAEGGCNRSKSCGLYVNANFSGQSENTVVQFFRDKHDEYGLFCRLLSFALNQGSGSGAAELCLTSAWSDRQGAKPEDIQPHTSTASEMPNKRQTELVRHLRSRFDKFAIPVRKFRVRRTLHMRLSRVWQLRSHHYICSQPGFRTDPQLGSIRAIYLICIICQIEGNARKVGYRKVF